MMKAITEAKIMKKRIKKKKFAYVHKCVMYAMTYNLAYTVAQRAYYETSPISLKRLSHAMYVNTKRFIQTIFYRYDPSSYVHSLQYSYHRHSNLPFVDYLRYYPMHIPIILQDARVNLDGDVINIEGEWVLVSRTWKVVKRVY